MAKLYLVENGTPEIQRATNSSPATATSLLTFVELRAALARSKRTGRLAESEHRNAVAGLVARWSKYQVILVDEGLVTAAAQLAEQHDLSGGDAIHMASAIELVSSGETSVSFATWDRRLWQAARAEGFDVLPESAP